MRCAVLDDYQGVAPGIVDWPCEVVSFREHFSDENALVSALLGYDVVVTLRERVAFPRSVLERLPDLRLLVASGMRNTVIDCGAARELGVTVCGTESSSTPPVELTWALVLGLTKNLLVEDVQRGGWQSTVSADLHGRTLGLLGLGKIGSKVAAVGLAFGMDVQAWSQNLTAERCDEVGVRHAPSKADLLRSSDVVSVHLALGDRTRGLIGRDDLALMPATSYLVNTSRAAIVDSDALLEALHAGTIAGAGLDVYDVEPLPPDSPWRTAPRLLATPHLGYVTEANYRTYFTQTVEAIGAFAAGAPIRELTAAR